ncbi:MAG: hypothetical protein Q8L48_19920 [Archangium sp.]|nr:hypothetical protein [Archangium sp.]
MFKQLLLASCAVMVIGGCQCPNPNPSSDGGDDGGTGGAAGGGVGGGTGMGGGTGTGGGNGQLPDAGMCVAAGDPCSTTEPCCSGQCAGAVCTSSTFCRDPGGACTLDTDCCNNNCVSGQCATAACVATGQACQAPDECCTGVCNANTCAAITGGGQCKVLGDSCGTAVDGGIGGNCCSSLCRSGVCAKAYYCQPNGDRCGSDAECCGRACSVDDGGVGFCEDITGGGGGGCTQEGNPCAGGSNCCSRTCFDPGSGATVCLPAGGCRLTGTSCSGDDACCGGGVNPNGTVQCADGRCDNGQSCNGVGNICGLAKLPDGGSVMINASQNCCNGMKEVCKLDSSGIPRCYGGSSGSCPTGYTGDPGCCIAMGDVCQFRDQCCSDALCLPGDGGVLRCQTPSCTPLGGTCAMDANCCGGALCLGGVCRPFEEGPGDAGTLPDGGAVDAGVSDGGGLCRANGLGCAFSADCCSQICTAGVCGTPVVCQGIGAICTASSDCCSGSTCVIAAGAEFGTCQGAQCVGSGQTCSMGGTSCCSGLSCLNASLQTCGATGACTCTVQIN